MQLIFYHSNNAILYLFFALSVFLSLFTLMFFKTKFPARKFYLAMFSFLIFICSTQLISIYCNKKIQLKCNDKGLEFKSLLFLSGCEVPWDKIENFYIYDSLLIDPVSNSSVSNLCKTTELLMKNQLSQPVMVIQLNESLAHFQKNFFSKMGAYIYSWLIWLKMLRDNITYDSSKTILLFSFTVEDSLEKLIKTLSDKIDNNN